MIKKAIDLGQSPDCPKIAAHRFPFAASENGLSLSGYNYVIPNISVKSMQEYTDAVIFVRDITPGNKRISLLYIYLYSSQIILASSLDSGDTGRGGYRQNG